MYYLRYVKCIEFNINFSTVYDNKKFIPTRFNTCLDISLLYEKYFYEFYMFLKSLAIRERSSNNILISKG